MPKQLLTIDWHITQKCNQACKHCYAAGEQFQGEVIPQETLGIIDKMLSLKKDFNVRVTLTGGEPLLRDDVFEIASLLLENSVPISLTTNGILVRKNINKIVNSGIMQIQVSIDGMRSVHDYLRGLNTFDSAIQALHLLKKEDLLPSVMTAVNSHNFKQVPEIIDLVRSMSIPLLGIQRFIPTGRGTGFKNLALAPENCRALLEFIMSKKEELKDEICIVTPDPLKVLIDRREAAGCPIGNNIMALTPNGDMLPCCKLPISLGNLISQDFPEVWNSKIMDTMRSGSNLKGKCGHCVHREICRGCRGAAYAAYGDYLAEDPQCWLKSHTQDL
ncbi:MAG: radical SAM protein [Candidatus Methanoperedens sp.]|nr:radical SAM protein [Candidatus Methanoperedens sp.]